MWVFFCVCFFKSISAPRPSFPERSGTFRGTRTVLERIFCALVPGRHGLNANLSALGGGGTLWSSRTERCLRRPVPVGFRTRGSAQGPEGAFHIELCKNPTQPF